MTILLVRHAKAGDRSKWEGPDDIRPLSPKGREQAVRLVDQLAGRGITRILTSAAVRCRQTVEPLAASVGLPVEESEALAEGASAAQVVELARALQDEVAVLSTHGDVIPTLLDALARSDGLRLPPRYPCEKGSTWVLDSDGDGRFVSAEYLEAP